MNKLLVASAALLDGRCSISFSTNHFWICGIPNWTEFRRWGPGNARQQEWACRSLG